MPFPETPAAWRAEVAKLHEESDGRFALEADEEAGAYWEAVKGHLASLLEDQELRIRMKPSDLERWLEKREALTFHATGITNGRDDPELRRNLEFEMLGIARDAGTEMRPRYGYVRGSNERGAGLNNFGHVLVRLKPHLRDQATVVLGDSMGSATRVQSIPGGWPCMVAEPLADVGELLCRYPAQNVAGAPRLADACDQDYQYAEVQIYDPLTPDAIKGIVFCNGVKAPSDLRLLLIQLSIEFDEIDDVPA